MATGAQESSSIFRQSAMNRIASVDDLDRYIHVSNPSVWVVLGAILVMLIGFTYWGATSSIPTTVSGAGIVMEEKADDGSLLVECYFDAEAVANMDSSDQAMVNNIEGRVVSVDDVPLSKSELASMLGSDFAMEVLGVSTWNYRVVIQLKVPEGSSLDAKKVVPVKVTVLERSPLSLVFG